MSPSPVNPAGARPLPATNPAHLPDLLHQLVGELTDPAVSYLLGGHYYERTNHSRTRHFPAVFALRQDEVDNVEVGPDYLAFDTEFVRYGEEEAPGRTDRFRATIPFAQLYQVCRKVLTPEELLADTVSYGQETIVYYNAIAHRNYPTPADINQAYAAGPATGEHPLVAVLAMLAAGLADPHNHYLVNTTFFDSPAGPVLLGMLHLHANTVRELVIEEESFTCSVLLDPRDRRHYSPVRVSFAQVWQVVAGNSPSIDLEEAEERGGILYDAPQVLRAYLQAQQPT